MVLELPLCKMTSLRGLQSLKIELIEVIEDVRVANDCLLGLQAAQSVNELKCVRVVSELSSPVVIVELCIVISIDENARLAEELRIRFALPTEADNLVSINRPRTLVANSVAIVAICTQRTKPFELLLRQEVDILDNFPVYNDLNTLKFLKLLHPGSQPLKALLFALFCQHGQLDFV